MYDFEYVLDSSVVLAGRKMLKKYLIILLIALPLLVSSEYFIKFFTKKDYLQLITGFISIFLFYLIVFVANKISKKLITKNNEKFLNQNVHISFSDSNITVKTKKEDKFESSQIYEWTMIQKFKQDNSYYFLYLSKLQSYVIPKGSCITGNESDFGSFIEDKLRKTT